MRISAEYFLLMLTQIQKKSAFEHSAAVTAVRAKVSEYYLFYIARDRQSQNSFPFAAKLSKT
jgi:hypothetical protein